MSSDYFETLLEWSLLSIAFVIWTAQHAARLNHRLATWFVNAVQVEI